MIFRRNKDAWKGAPRELAEAQRLSAQQDWESLARALDLTEGWANFASERGHPELGPPAVAIRRSVLPRIQQLGHARCVDLLQTARRLLGEGQYHKAREVAESSAIVFDKSHLGERPSADESKLLRETITGLLNDDRIRRVVAEEWKAETDRDAQKRRAAATAELEARIRVENEIRLFRIQEALQRELRNSPEATQARNDRMAEKAERRRQA